MKKQTTIITIIIITAIVFFGLGYIISSGEIIIPKTSDVQGDTFQAGWDAAKKRLIETGFMPMLEGEDIEIKSVSGTVQEIKNNKITLKIQPLEPLANPELDIRIIEVDDARVYGLIEKDPEQFKKEMKEFEDKINEQTNNFDIESGDLPELITPPDMFIKQSINVGDLEVGQQLMVTTEVDIKEVKQFEAIEVIMQFMSVIPQITDDGLDILPMTEMDMEM